MATETTLALMRRQRETWFELDDPPRRALLLRRPQTERLAQLRDESIARGEERIGGNAMRELVKDSVVDWRGVTGADLLGPTVGSTDEEPFDAALFREWAGDHVEELMRASFALLTAVKVYQDRADAAAKNSPTS